MIFVTTIMILYRTLYRNIISIIVLNIEARQYNIKIDLAISCSPRSDTEVVDDYTNILLSYKNVRIDPTSLFLSVIQKKTSPNHRPPTSLFLPSIPNTEQQSGTLAILNKTTRRHCMRVYIERATAPARRPSSRRPCPALLDCCFCCFCCRRETWRCANEKSWLRANLAGKRRAQLTDFGIIFIEKVSFPTARVHAPPQPWNAKSRELLCACIYGVNELF